jgi:hypothetical protein
LYSYKILIENSPGYAGYAVTGGRLEFVEPDSNGKINTLNLAFANDELKRTQLLLSTLWQHVHALNFPSVAKYEPNPAGIKQFEQDLIDKKI